LFFNIERKREEYMNLTSVRFLQATVVSSGIIKIENIGAGVGVILYNSQQRIAAGLHIMAPSSKAVNAKNPIMYADTAIPHILVELKKRGAGPPYSVAVAGGAGMIGSRNGLDIGRKVVAAVQAALKRSGLVVKVNKTGGTQVRTMLLDVDAGKIKVV
jgi:chemotaxis receptor (MCP) glutamine deamidase CheD